ncbi:MAG: hypothetical protein Q4P84_00310 [Elusimicrobiales bacterium]|nr:hypothetical protein [Elusimicrobiales bacterium]
MSYTPVQSDINMLFQKVKKRKIRLELLDKKFRVLSMIEGNCESDNFSIDSTSLIRRTYSCNLHIADDSLLIGPDKIVWFDKYIRPYVGIYNPRTKKYIWYLKGTFAYETADYSYDENNNTLSLSCVDLISILTGDRNGRQTGLDFTIPQGEDVRKSIIGIIKTFGFTQYRIDIPDTTVAYDLEFSANASAHEMIEELMQFCPNYEYFFDIDGIFVVQRIPCFSNDVTILDDKVLHKLKTSDPESYSVDFKTVKNCIEVWGHEFDEEELSGFNTATYSNGMYDVTFEAITALEEYMVVGMTVPAANPANTKVRINGKWTFELIDRYNKSVPAGTMQKDTSYMFLYQNSKLYYLGGFNIHAIFKNEFPNSQFSIENVGEEIWEIKSGGEYEDILSDAEAMERAMYECYLSNFNESLSFSIEDIPWLDVNQKVSYLPQNANSEKPLEWLITSISGSADENGSTIDLSLIRFYPDWSEIYKEIAR